MTNHPHDTKLAGAVDAIFNMLGYKYCGLYTAIGSKQYRNVWVKHDKSGVVAILTDMLTEEEADKAKQAILDLLDTAMEQTSLHQRAYDEQEFTSARSEAYEQGRIDEAKTCEQARRHDIEKARSDWAKEVELPKKVKLAGNSKSPLFTIDDESYDMGYNQALDEVTKILKEMK